MFDLARQLGKKVFKVADRMPDRRDRISYGVASRNVYAATHYVRPQACLAKQVVKVAGVRRLGRSPQINDLTQHAKQIFPQIDVSGVVYGCYAGLLGGFCNLLDLGEYHFQLCMAVRATSTWLLALVAKSIRSRSA
jgi:hypothetical protein